MHRPVVCPKNGFEASLEEFMLEQLDILGCMCSLSQPLPGIDNQRISVKAPGPIVEAMCPGEEMRFDASDPRCTHASMSGNRYHVIMSLPYGLIGICCSIKIIRAKFVGVRAPPLCSRSTFYESRRRSRMQGATFAVCFCSSPISSYHRSGYPRTWGADRVGKCRKQITTECLCPTA
jgi:hypothetical protein